MSTAPLAGPPQASTPSDPSSSSSSLSWEGDKMFNIYIYDYCHKRGFKRTAKELLAEAEIPPDSTPPINARQGLLFEWWSVFWVLFTAKANGSGPEDAMVYTQHQAAQARQRQAQMPGQPIPGSQPGQMPQQPHMRPMNGIPTNANQPRFGGPNGPIPNGVPPGQQGFPPGQPPPQMNGIPGPGGPPNAQNFTMMAGPRGAMPPGARGPVNGAGPPFHPSPSAMDPSSQNPGGQPNPQTPQQQPGQPPMTRMLPPNGMHPGMNPGQVPNPNPSYPMGRPPSRAATPGGSMMASQSPSLQHRQIMDINALNAEIQKIPHPVMQSLRQELGLEKDFQAFTTEDKSRLLQVHRQRMRIQKPGVPPNAMAGPSTNPGMPPRNNTGRPPKRNSTSPGDEQEPPGAGSSPKRIRRSPMEQHQMTGMAGTSYPQPPQQGQLPQQGGPQHLIRMGGGPQQPPQGSFNMMNPMGGPMMNAPMGGPLSPAMVPNQAGLMQQPMQMMRDGQYRAVMHGGRPPMMPPQPGMMPNPMSNAGSPAADPNFPGGPPFNPAGGPPPPGPGNPNSRQQQPPQQQGPPGGKPAMGMLPPPSPGMQKDKDVKLEGSPRNNNMGTAGTPSASGTAPPTPVTANPPPPPPPPPPTTMDPSALLGLTSADMFTTDFITNVASTLDVDFNPGAMFNPTGDMSDINFERDFGQWFDPTDALAPLDMTK